MKANPALLLILIACGVVIHSTRANSYSITVANGYNLIANQLDDPANNSINTILLDASEGDFLFKWDHASQQFLQADTFFGGTWYDANFNPSTTTLDPGEAAFLQNNSGAASVLSFNGTPRTVPPASPVFLFPGWNFRSCQAPQVAGYDEIIGAPPANGTCFFQYQALGQPYQIPPLPTCSSLDPGGWLLHVFLNGNWYRVNSLNNLSLAPAPQAQPGEGVVIYVLHDNTPPTLNCSVAVTSMSHSPNFLQNVGLNIAASDNCAASPTVTVSVYSDEPAAAGNSPDATYVGGVLSLRRERSASGDGRVYLIVVTASDNFGNSVFCCRTVVVPHDNSASSIASVNAQATAVLNSCGPNGSPLTPNLIPH